MKVKYDYKDIINNINILNNNNEEKQYSFFTDYFYNTLSSLDEYFIDCLQNITKIDNYAFYECESLESATIPNGVTRIGYEAFCFCEKLANVSIPDTVTEIECDVFWNCESLTDMYLHPTTPPILVSTSAISSATTAIHVPVGCGDAYKSATNWSSFADIIVEDIVIE